VDLLLIYELKQVQTKIFIFCTLIKTGGDGRREERGREVEEIRVQWDRE
jgi:hypothetical protein